MKKHIKNNYKVSDSYYYLGSIYNYPKFREPDKTSQRANEYFLKALEGEEKGKVYKELGYLQRYTLNSKKAEEYYLKAYENGNYASLCGLLLMYRDLSHRPFSNGYEYRGSEKRVALITDRYNKKLKGFTEEENEKLTSYSRQIYQTDLATQEFLNQLSVLEKEVTVVFYGDHLPGLYPQATFADRPETQFQTEYFIWSNNFIFFCFDS